MPVTTVFVESSEQDAAVDGAQFWWLIGLLGTASLVAGVILVLKPSDSLATLAVIFGIFLLLDGIVALVSSFRQEEGSRALAAIVGVLGVVVGIILIRHPTHAVSAVGLLIGIWLVAAGIVRLVRAIAGRGSGWLGVVVAILQIVVGIVIVSDPHIGYATLAILLGIWLIINGLGMLAWAYLLHRIHAEGSAP